MNAVKLTVACFLLAGLPLLATADANAAAKSAGAKQDADPDWVVVEDEWLYPLRLDSVEALDKADFHYRRNEEKAAAREVREAVSWLEYAATHAQPMTRDKLETAKMDLRTLADDLSNGRVVGAERMSHSLARASEGLAEWHYYRAKEQYGKHDALRASQDLEAAAAHLQRAANSARYQYGPDTIVLFNDIIEDGWVIEKGRMVGNDRLSKQLDAIEGAVKEMADALA